MILVDVHALTLFVERLHLQTLLLQQLFIFSLWWTFVELGITPAAVTRRSELL